MPDTTPLPLPECPREDCTASVDHYHGNYVRACWLLLGEECDHDDEDDDGPSPCYAPRTQHAPARPPLTAILDAILAAAADAKRAHDQMCDLAETLLPDPQPAPQPPAGVLPTVDEVAARLLVYDVEIGNCSDDLTWANADRELQHEFREAARAVLDLIAARITPWEPVAPGTVIKAGTRYRIEFLDGDVTGCYIDPRTVPAEPEDPRVAVVAKAMSDALDDNGVTTCDWTAEARFILGAIRAEYVIEPKAADQ